MLDRFWAVLVARNKEFFRDRSALAWNLLFPFLVVFGFAFMFTDRAQDVFSVAVLGDTEYAFLETEHIDFITVVDGDEQKTLEKLGRHQFDMVVDTSSEPPRYWINATSPKGKLLEPLLRGTQGGAEFVKETVEGDEIRYVDWLVPGLLAMNMMFSCLFGVGWVIVRYRKNGVLRRLKATPLSAFEFLSAQVGSRLVVTMAATIIIYFGADLFLDFHMIGNYLTLGLVFVVGAMCLIALGLLIAARTASEELAGGLLNLISWPMMFMSGVWFSLERTPEWVQKLALVFPLTHMIEAARNIMTEGATLLDVMPAMLVMIGMTVAFTAIGAWGFKWE